MEESKELQKLYGFMQAFIYIDVKRHRGHISEGRI